MSRLALTLGFTSLLSLSTLSFATSSHAAILDGGFETGTFTNWQTFGTTSIQTSSFGSGPTEGTYQALLESVQDDNYLALEQFLELTPGTLDTLGYGEAFGGSAIKQAFTANAGDTLSFKWNFLTDESTPSTSNDFAFVLTLTPTGLADTNATFLPSSTVFANETGFQSFSLQLFTPGSYTLGIGVVNTADREVKSGLLVDGVEVKPASTSVPTPALLPGLIILGLRTLKKVRKQARE